MQLIDSFNKLIILLPRNCEYGSILDKHRNIFPSFV